LFPCHATTVTPPDNKKDSPIEQIPPAPSPSKRRSPPRFPPIAASSKKTPHFSRIFSKNPANLIAKTKKEQKKCEISMNKPCAPLLVKMMNNHPPQPDALEPRRRGTKQANIGTDKSESNAGRAETAGPG
jgi:hypothetical protein